MALCWDLQFRAITEHSLSGRGGPRHTYLATRGCHRSYRHRGTQTQRPRGKRSNRKQQPLGQRAEHMGTSHGSRRDAGKHPGAGPPSETGEAPGFIQGGPFHLPATASVELIAPAPVGAPPSGEGWREGGRCHLRGRTSASWADLWDDQSEAGPGAGGALEQDPGRDAETKAPVPWPVTEARENFLHPLHTCNRNIQTQKVLGEIH